MPGPAPLRIDLHVHVAVLGDDPAFQPYGKISTWMREQPLFSIMLLYARVEPRRVSDQAFKAAVLKAITTCSLDRVVCLALDPVYDEAGKRCECRSNMWVDNDYIVKELRPAASDRILLGASVHPYDPTFETRVAKCVADGAVLLKWLPSAQQINLADQRVLEALRFTATAGPNGRPLPVLIHVGPEYTIMTTDPRTWSYDFLSWGFWDRLGNVFRTKAKRWIVPDVRGTLASLRAGVAAGARIIFAHCGLPYFAPRFLGFLEHSDFDVVRTLLKETAGTPVQAGGFYTDVSACVTPFRQSFFPDIAALPPDRVLAGSDFPVPAFELSADLEENARDFEAMMTRGQVERIVIPQDNLLDVNWRELKYAFGDHPMFRNAERLLFDSA